MPEPTYDTCCCQSDPDMRRLWALIRAGYDQMTASRIVWDPTSVDATRVVAERLVLRNAHALTQAVTQPRPLNVPDSFPVVRPSQLDRPLLITLAVSLAAEASRLLTAVTRRRTTQPEPQPKARRGRATT